MILDRVKSDTQSGTFLSSSAFRRTFLTKLVIFALLLAVAGLATMAKNGQYFPEASAAHYVSISTKMNVAHPPLHFGGDDLQPVARFFSLQLPMRAIRRVEKPTAPPLILKVCLTDSKQLRAPPAARA
jgi:hypothetical protein